MQGVPRTGDRDSNSSIFHKRVQYRTYKIFPPSSVEGPAPLYLFLLLASRLGVHAYHDGSVIGAARLQERRTRREIPHGLLQKRPSAVNVTLQHQRQRRRDEELYRSTVSQGGTYSGSVVHLEGRSVDRGVSRVGLIVDLVRSDGVPV